MDAIEIRQVENVKDLNACHYIRRKVFTLEQGIPAHLDMDASESQSVSILLLKNNQPIGTGRLLIEDHSACLSRIALLKEERGFGYGKIIVSNLEKIAIAKKAKLAYLHPHDFLESFYARLGYVKTKDIEEKVGIHQLIRMDKDLT